MALQTFTWNNGTNEHPVELNSTQMSLLLKLSLDTSVQSDVRGHITTSSGRIAKYTKWQLNQKYGENLVIHAEEDEDVFSIIPVRNAINEGESTVITVTGMSASSVKFRLLHSFRNVYGISQAKAQARIRMEGNTLVVNQPEENASWTDEVTIQAIPLYEDWNTIDSSSIVSCTVTVSAKELTGIVLTSPSMVVYGEMFQSEVTLIPSSNTKKNFVTLDAICITDGSIPVRKPTTQGGYIYTQAPSEQCNLTLTVNAYLFNDLDTIVFSAQGEMESAIPYIRFIVTTDGTFSDISTANPKITLQKVNSEDEPIGEPVVLTGSPIDSSLVYTYGNNVASDGSETYQVTFGEAPQGYRNIQQMTITPNQVITEVAVQYIVKIPDIYFVYGDGDYEPLSAIETRGSFKSGKTRVGIAIVSENTSFIIGVSSDFKPTNRFNCDRYIASLDTVDEGVPASTIPLDALEDFNGEQNTTKIYNAWADKRGNENVVGAIFEIYERTVTINNVVYHGFLPAYGQLMLIINNATAINNFIETYMGLSKYLQYLPTSTQQQKYDSSSKYSGNRYWTYNSYSSTDALGTQRNDTYNNFHHNLVTCFRFDLAI